MTNTLCSCHLLITMFEQFDFFLRWWMLYSCHDLLITMFEQFDFFLGWWTHLDVQIARLRLLPHLASKSIACISRFSSFIFFSLPVSQWGWIVDWVDVNWTSLSLLYKIVPDQVLDMLDLAAGVAFVISCFVVRKIKFRLNWKSVILLTTQKNRVQISPTLIVWSLLWWSNRPIWFCFLEILKN